ncbi:MAG TPA: hypothetical protein VMM76_13860 [Pirellulaceae bacterium]|nr:hypothetical protein [Pirellulaceae bacterium]
MNKQIFLLVSAACVVVPVFAQAQVVQLPTYHVFSVRTTVSVPDGGAAYLGGVTRGAWGSSSRGVPGLSQVPGVNRLFTNRSFGSSVSSSHAYATATIIDHAEMDRMVLAEAAARRGELGVASETERRAAHLSAFVARSPQPSRASPIATHQARTLDPVDRVAAARAAHEAEMLAYVQRAELAEAAGSFGAARCSYNVLARRGNDEQQQLAARRLAALTAPATK